VKNPPFSKSTIYHGIAFEANCNKIVEYEQQVFDFHGSVQNEIDGGFAGVRSSAR